MRSRWSDFDSHRRVRSGSRRPVWQPNWHLLFEAGSFRRPFLPSEMFLTSAFPRRWPFNVELYMKDENARWVDRYLRAYSYIGHLMA